MVVRIDPKKGYWTVLLVYAPQAGCPENEKIEIYLRLDDEHKQYGAALWFETMWTMYEVVEMGDRWGSELPNLFATLSYNNPDFMDWSLIYDTVFTRSLRAMGLSIREGKTPAGGATAVESLGGLARIVVATFGGPRGCQGHLQRMMKMVEPFMHPSNESSHTLLVLVFLQNLLQEMVNRYREERIKNHKRRVPREYFLTDEDIVQFTEAILPSLLYAIYIKDGTTSKVKDWNAKTLDIDLSL
ncbi:hypothetical protein TELCIR_06323 [Teladorsagia circumcincta]|uniref:Proteasome activator Blm10 middle HEAT repeats region domain-containing protein n=1 Tax=Teladorsagia circumcincta TaxID=45464 RepID=A0A2G9UNN6_TELCI|nr:hypothetical protein TELCIR_06323 [Teladorsagia circumcincta]